MTPSGWPVIGRAPKIDNLFFNMGHGMLGFTLAFGAAKLTSDLVAGRPNDLIFSASPG
jgi:D-amino-acid dehydrogenase